MKKYLLELLTSLVIKKNASVTILSYEYTTLHLSTIFLYFSDFFFQKNTNFYWYSFVVS